MQFFLTTYGENHLHMSYRPLGESGRREESVHPDGNKKKSNIENMYNKTNLTA